jgi:hypothetical protein
MSAEGYTRSFRSLIDTLSEAGVRAPVFLAVATRCDTPWTPDNPVARAQRALVDDRRIFLGADTDALVTASDRRDDGCHFAASGQAKAAETFARAIARVRRP